jgi:hypothetical protein
VVVTNSTAHGKQHRRDGPQDGAVDGFSAAGIID